MKRTTKLIIAFILGSIVSVYALSGGESAYPERYCARLQDGKRVVMHMGSPITDDVTLSNGTIVKPGGTVVMGNGISMILKNGQCIGKDGVICEEKYKDKKAK